MRQGNLLLGALTLSLTLLGCGASKQNGAQVQELSKELEDTKRELAAAREQAIAAGQPAARDIEAAGARTPVPATNPPAGQPPKQTRLPRQAAGSSDATLERTSPVAAVPQSKEVAADTQEVARRAEAGRPPAPRVRVLPAGTTVRIRTISPLSTKTSTTGSQFEATLAEPLAVDGYTVARRGATVRGVVAASDPGGRTRGRAAMSLQLQSIAGESGRINIQTEDMTRTAASSVKKDAAKVGIATGVGAAIGAIAGGGKGAAIGAGVGAGGGAGVAMATRGDAAEIPAETVLTFTLAAPVEVQEVRR